VSRAKAPLRPLPRPEGLGAEFYAHCARGRLCFQRCDACGRWRHLPRHMCAECGSPTWRWAESSGRGRLHSWTVTHAPLHPAFAAELPYVVAVVELEEGVRMVSGVRGVAPEQLALDLPLEVYFEPVAEGVRLPYFRPAPQTGGQAR
jgi:uncharacterized OB-fold protein